MAGGRGRAGKGMTASKGRISWSITRKIVKLDMEVMGEHLSICWVSAVCALSG